MAVLSVSVQCVCDVQKCPQWLADNRAEVATRELSASGLELELLVLECPSRGAAAEAAEKFTFPPGVLCWHHTLQAPRAKSIGEHCFYFLAPILHGLLFQVPISLNQNSYSAVPVEGQWCVLSWQWF